MEYRLLGNSGLLVSRLAFGAMTFSSGNRDLSLFNVDPDSADGLVGQAIDAGVNFFDTADVYAGGQSEEILGKALAPHRQNVVIATKVGGRSSQQPLDAGLTRRHILASVDASLRRLGTDWIDVYLVHRECSNTPLEETLSTLDAIVRAGKVRYLGFSNWSAWRVVAAMEMMRANNLVPFTHGQLYYSLVGRDIEDELLPALAHYGLGLTVWSPLAGGFLTGKYRRGAQPDEGTRAADFPAMPMDVDRSYATLDVMRQVADTHGASLAQIALAWLLERQPVTSILLGASKSDQLADTLKAVNVRLSAEQCAALDAVSAGEPRYPHWFLELFSDQVITGLLATARN
ncbi:aldo/keto reductase [Sphingobium sp. DEHP117]|uniref:aldo/keto reductase n=1 Tax=Sphingobium sp. DEHP117 TaxID=2993436 RepID=UPI0027D5EE98|nr:aldo/keto reductase [Sphingobium sp. DEHP117]MDQ4420359.1 aldo/keto reductase [Sphingobium sp. DEHP117]